MNFETINPDDVTLATLKGTGITMLKDEPQLWLRGTKLDSNKDTKWENIGITLATGEVDKSVLYLVVEIQDEKIAIPYVRDWKVQDDHIMLNAPAGTYINEVMNQHFQTIVNEVKSEEE